MSSLAAQSPHGAPSSPSVLPHSKGEELEDLFPIREKPRQLLHGLLPLPLDQPSRLHTLQPRSCLPRAPAPALLQGPVDESLASEPGRPRVA